LEHEYTNYLLQANYSILTVLGIGLKKIVTNNPGSFLAQVMERNIL